MIGQYIELPNDSWSVLIYYYTQPDDLEDIEDILIEYGCPIKSAHKSASIVSNRLNTGLTFSNTDLKMSIVCISNATSQSQMADTIVHEIKHVQSHICEYYEVDEDSEPASYLIGYLARLIYKFISRFV